MAQSNGRCNLPLIFDIIKLYREEYTNENDIKLSAYFKNSYIRIITKELKKCLYLHDKLISNKIL